MALICAGFATESAVGWNSTAEPDKQKVQNPHRPPGTASTSPKYDAKAVAKPVHVVYKMISCEKWSGLTFIIRRKVDDLLYLLDCFVFPCKHSLIHEVC